MRSTQDVMKLTGMSKSRCLQFAKSYGVPKIGQSYVWDDEAVREFEGRIGLRGKRVTKRSDG